MRIFYIVTVDHPDAINNPYIMRGDDSNFSGVGAIPSLFFTEEFANKMIEQYNRKCWQIGSKRCKTHIQKIKITEIVS